MKRITRTSLRLALAGGLAAAGMLLASCAYHETMREREIEGSQLRSELEQEQARTGKLIR